MTEILMEGTITQQENVEAFVREPDPRGEPWDEESEEFKLEKRVWLERASTSPESFEEFANFIMRRPHDCGTIVWACLAAMGKAFNIINNHPVDGGITGFQAGALQWMVLRHIFHKNSSTGYQLADYDWLLNPDNEEHFTTVPANIWKLVVEEAKKRLELHETGEELAPVSLREHWANIVAGMVPFGLKVGVAIESE